MQAARASLSGAGACNDTMLWLAGPAGVTAGADVDSCGSNSAAGAIEACTSPRLLERRKCPGVKGPTSAAISWFFQSSSMPVNCLERSLPKSCLCRVFILCRTCIQGKARFVRLPMSIVKTCIDLIVHGHHQAYIVSPAGRHSEPLCRS